MEGAGESLTKSVSVPMAAAGTAAIKFASESQDAYKQFAAATGTATENLGKYQDMINNVYKDNFGESMWEDLGPQVITTLSTTNGAIDKTKETMEELVNTRYDTLTGALGGLWRTIQVDVLQPVGIIMAAYTKVYRKNKKPYIAQMNGDALEVIEKGKTIPGFHIKQGERILESSYSENTDDMVNRVYVYNSSNKKIGILTNTRWANMYGIFQSVITVDSGNGKQEAMNELKGISKNASLTSTGDYRCVSGLGVIIEDSRTGLKGRFWIESDSHEWKNGSYTMKLDLEFKNIMDTQEEDEEETSSSSSGSSESSALEDVLNQARSWIGIGENPPGSNHNEITVLYGMDAAWCCMFIWACFNKSGHADLFMGGAKEAYCFNVRDYYQARGKWGSTPKKGALVIYGGQGHIGIVESVNSAGGYTSIEGNYGDDVKRRDSHQNVLGFCYIDYPVTRSAEGSNEVISGTTVSVPGSVAQTGIIKDYTNYSYFFGRWKKYSIQKTIADLWGNNGKPGKNGIATINGYYLIALRPVFGSAGDVVSVVLEDGTRFNAIMADEKGDDAGNQWGHVYSGAVSIVEFESLGNSEANNGAQLNIGQWAGKKVTAIINGGRYSGL